MNTCDTCKHWHREIKVEHASYCGMCICEKLCHDSPDGAYAWHKEGGCFQDYGFYTGPKFGCVHWEKKD